MQIKVFSIPFSPALGGFDDEPLRTFLMDKQVHKVESWNFVYEGLPYWSVLVSYSLPEMDAVGVKQTARKADADTKKDWRKKLDEGQWRVFNALREWRKAKALAEGIPPYLVFTNEQLSRIVIEKIASLSSLGQIEGIGPSRVEKYGRDVLALLKGKADEEGGDARTAGADRVDGVPGVAAADDGEVSEEGAVHPDEPD